MLVLFTDFGLDGPYTGQVNAVLQREAPGVPVIQLFADAPTGQPKPAAYLLAAYADWFPPGAVLLCVVDPGVGGDRRAVIAESGGRIFVGPDNGLFELVLRRGAQPHLWEITWQPASLSTNFHCRDLFAPVAALLAHGTARNGLASQIEIVTRRDWPDDLAGDRLHRPLRQRIDRLAGIGSSHRHGCAAGRVIAPAKTFPRYRPVKLLVREFRRLVEIAVNSGRAGTPWACDRDPIAIG
jgi:hypothetical protein